MTSQSKRGSEPGSCNRRASGRRTCGGRADGQSDHQDRTPNGCAARSTTAVTRAERKLGSKEGVARCLSCGRAATQQLFGIDQECRDYNLVGEAGFAALLEKRRLLTRECGISRASWILSLQRDVTVGDER